MNFRTFFFLIIIALSSNSYAQWWVDGGNVIWPHGDVKIPNGELTLAHPPNVVNYVPAIFSHSTWWDEAEPCFRLMVDDSLGDDSNNGGTWSTAKKTIQGAIDALPDDLQGRIAFLFFHPGIYTGTADMRTKYNGSIELRWVGMFANTNYSTSINGAYTTFLRNGAVDPIRDSSQVIFDLTPTGSAAISAYHTSTIKFSLIFSAANEDYAYNVVGHAYWNQIVIRMADGFTDDNLVHYDGDGEVQFRNGVTLDLNGTSRAGVYSGGKVSLIYLKVIGDSLGTASTSTSAWYGALSCVGNKGWDIRPGSNYAWAPGHAPPISGKAYYIEGVRTLLTTPWYSTNFNGNTMNFGSAISYTQGELPDTLHPYIRLHSTGYFSGQLTYNSDQVSLTDNAVLQRIITDNAISETRYYYNENLYDRGDSLFYKGTAIAP